MTANGNVTQPIRWSSEYNDTELGLVYYNYRHYNPADGRWTGRDPLRENTRRALYRYGNAVSTTDVLGLDDSYAAFVSGPDGNWTPNHLPWWLGLTPYERLNDRQGGFGGFAMDPYEPLPYKLPEPKLPNVKPVVGLLYAGKFRGYLCECNVNAKLGMTGYVEGSVVFDATATKYSASHTTGVFVNNGPVGSSLEVMYECISGTRTYTLRRSNMDLSLTGPWIRFGLTPREGTRVELVFNNKSYRFEEVSVTDSVSLSDYWKFKWRASAYMDAEKYRFPVSASIGVFYNNSGEYNMTLDVYVYINSRESGAGFGVGFSF